MATAHTDRWRRRPFLAAALRLAVTVTPICAAVATSAGLARALPAARSGWELAGFWVIAFAVSSGVLLLAHRAMRRLMPLAVMMTLSLAFPDEAPSRLRLAREAMSTAKLRTRLEHAREHGVDDEPTRAAEQILALVAAVEAHDRGTRGHSERVRLFTDLLADEMALPRDAKDRLRWSALLHDVGKLSVPGEVLNKPGALDDDEWQQVRKHPEEGARLARPLRSWLGEWACAIEEHHERYDGSGYPRGAAGHDISLAGRMVAVTDAFETMTAARPYRRPRSARAAREELVRCSGSEFDPVVVRAFLRISVGKLGVVSGPLAWLAQTPVLRGLEVVAETAGRAAAGAAAVGGTLAITMGPQGPPADPFVEPPPATQEVASNDALEDADSSPSPEATSPGRTDPTPEPSPSPSPTRDPTVGIDPTRSPSPSPSPTRDTTLEPGDPLEPGRTPEPSASAGTDGVSVGG